MEPGGPSGDRGLQQALRAAVERTLAATAVSASQTRPRAQELPDDIARRGPEARESVSRGGRAANLEQHFSRPPEIRSQPQVEVEGGCG